MAWLKWQEAKIEGVEFKDCIYEKKSRDRGGGVARLTFNRPERMNALTNVGFAEIVYAARDANLDPDIGVLVITSNGPHFGVGGDVRWEQAGGAQQIVGVPPANNEIRMCRKPVIAAVKGYCIGAHNHMAYTCDFTIAADTAIMGQNGPRIGSPVGGHTVSALAHIVGVKKAREVWMLCRQYTAQQALEMGLVNTVVPVDKLDEEVDKWCDELLDICPTILSFVKQSYNEVDDYLASNVSWKALMCPDIFASAEVKESQKAFFEKRPPNYWKPRIVARERGR